LLALRLEPLFEVLELRLGNLVEVLALAVGKLDFEIKASGLDALLLALVAVKTDLHHIFIHE
jgi:hypothetical protein